MPNHSGRTAPIQMGAFVARPDIHPFHVVEHHDVPPYEQYWPTAINHHLLRCRHDWVDSRLVSDSSSQTEHGPGRHSSRAGAFG